MVQPSLSVGSERVHPPVGLLMLTDSRPLSPQPQSPLSPSLGLFWTLHINEFIQSVGLVTVSFDVAWF